jgi:DNA-directed RNA polymerase alpha subunit
MAVKLTPADYDLTNARLKEGGVTSVDQLVQMTETDLLRILRNVTYLELVEEELAELGLTLRQDDRPNWLKGLRRWIYRGSLPHGG